MEKISLNALYKEAMEAKVLAAQEKAKTFAEKEMIPALIEAAKSGEVCATLHVPSGLIVEYVEAFVNEKIEYKSLKKDCRRLHYFWG